MEFADDSLRPPLPAEAPINESAGRGDALFVTLRLESGEEGLFLLDTGSPITTLDCSLADKLGKRLKRGRLMYQFEGVARKADVYAAPKLYLGNTPLSTGPRVWVLPEVVPQAASYNRKVLGTLGMDCLIHYCLQLDFGAQTIRFLDPDRLDPTGLGQAFPMPVCFLKRAMLDQDLLGAKGGKTMIDTGDVYDGTLQSRKFRKAVRGTLAEGADWAWFPTSPFGGGTYTNLILHRFTGPWFDSMGLHFLARHLVTLNFPKRTMYLQVRTEGSPAGERFPLASTLAWWDRRLPSPCPEPAEALARSIISPPNLHPSHVVSGEMQWLFNHPQFVPVHLPVGLAGDELSALQLAPGDYGIEVFSGFIPSSQGDGNLCMGMHAGGTERAKSTRQYLAKNCADWGVVGAADFSKPQRSLVERGTIFLLHDYNSQKASMAYWAYVLAQSGWRAVLIDLPGHGQSSGQTISYGKSEVEALKQALDSFEKRGLCHGKVGLLGAGYGANLALHWAAGDSRVGAVVAIGPYNRIEEAMERMAQNAQPKVSRELLHTALSRASQGLQIPWSDWSAEAAMRQVKQPVLLIGGGLDWVSSTNDLRVLEKAAPAGSKTILIPKAHHEDVQYWFHVAAEPVKSWFTIRTRQE